MNAWEKARAPPIAMQITLRFRSSLDIRKLLNADSNYQVPFSFHSSSSKTT
jgi:hypothetical protein